MGQTRTQAVLVTNQTALSEHQVAIDLALFDEVGEPVVVPKPLSIITVTGLIGTAAKTTTQAAPPVGALVPIKFTSGNSAAAPTVDFSDTSALPVLLGGATPASGEITIEANGVALFFYDGTSLHQIGVYS